MDVYEPNNLKFNYINYKNMPKENSKNNHKKNMNYYNQLINSMNAELGIKNNDINVNLNNNNISQRIKSNNIKNIYNYKKNISEDNNKLIELENNKNFLMEKNKEIEEQIAKLQNLAKKVNFINEKNIYYNQNNQSQQENNSHIKNYRSFNNTYDRNYNYSIDNQNNSIKCSNYSNFSNITQDRNNYIQIEDDSLEFFLDKNKNEANNIRLYEDINNYYNKYCINDNNKIKSKISLSSRNIRKNNLVSNYLNYIKKNKTFYRRKNSPNSLRMNIRYNKDFGSISTYKNENNENKSSIITKKNNDKNKKIKKICYNNINDINQKIEIIKNIIKELNTKNICKNNKNFLLGKINDIQNDFNFKISLMEKKYNDAINKKIRRINKLEIENANLKKKVTKIKSIV